ncbi:MAG: DNA mismatch repair protein MutS [Planctomycetes bacterium]|nr:DNA mismatch repair protein MutS [Planctomycetota bacterium]
MSVEVQPESTVQPARKAAAREPSAEALTPAMRQYAEQKSRVGDAILFFRMGDFYETFYDDAALCARVLGIALTSRSKGDNAIPLAGIPYHALDSYLRKLIAAGYRVAISEQLENPQQAKGIVRRDVVRVVTAGTLTDDSLLSGRDDNLLTAIVLRGRAAGCALVELASGRFETLDVTREALLDELVRARPAELLIDDERGSESQTVAEQVRHTCGTAISRRPLHEFTEFQAEKSLREHFGVVTLEGFGFARMSPSLCAAGAVIQYLQETQRTGLAHLTAIRARSTADSVQIDQNTWRALEIDRALRSGQREGTLLHAIDRTLHPQGARKLRHWLTTPLPDAEQIRRRQQAIAALACDSGVRSRLRERLKTLADVERITGRVALSRVSPRDLAGLGRTLCGLPSVVAELRGCDASMLEEVARDATGLEDVAELLHRAVRPDPPATVTEGGYMADGFDAELDRLRAIGRDGQVWLREYQQREIERTGLGSLKVGFNRVFGYYIEVNNSARERVPADYVRRQTVKNAERYITDELKRYESEVLTAQERAVEREACLFEELRARVADRIEALLRAADAIGRLDCLAGLAELAVERRYVRPEIVPWAAADPAPVLEIRDGRHPVLDQTLGDAFVPNDTAMSDDASRLFVLTGPNMAGKSTYVRQVALLTLLAHVGSFVPARSMRLSLVDRIFARIGAADEIARGQSTFMVEMIEAANILHHATRRSLVILDELGRGTSTFDGLSLAWAITEHLATQTRCRCFVATHYHELIALAELLPGVRNFHVAVREVPSSAPHGEGLVFLHRILEGGTSKSYGVHVARLAGIPPQVIQRSREVLAELQRGFERESHTPQLSPRKRTPDPQLMLFRDPAAEIAAELAATDPDGLSADDALRRIREWKERLE